MKIYIRSMVLPFVTMIILAPLLYWDFARVYRPQNLGKKNISQQSPQAAEATQHTPDIHKITSAQLFGNPELQAVGIENVDIPETQLELTLIGTFTHNNDLKASALIAENGNKPNRYLNGDVISGDTKLIQIQPGKVVLRRNGRNELLRISLLTVAQDGNASATDVADNTSMAQQTDKEVEPHK